MKKLLLPLLLISVLAMAGCQSKESKEFDAKYEKEKSIETYIEDHTYINFRMLDMDKNWVIVLLNDDGKADVTIRAYMPYYIPYVAEEITPIVQEALKENDTEIGEFSVDAYMDNNQGVVDNTMAGWTTKNWLTGIFVEDKKEGPVILQDVTIQDLYDYYADYADLIQDILNGKYD